MNPSDVAVLGPVGDHEGHSEGEAGDHGWNRPEEVQAAEDVYVPDFWLEKREEEGVPAGGPAGLAAGAEEVGTRLIQVGEEGHVAKLPVPVQVPEEPPCLAGRRHARKTGADRGDDADFHGLAHTQVTQCGAR